MIAIIFIVPLIQLLILANAITWDVKNIKLSMVDHDRSRLSRELYAIFAASPYFTMVDPVNQPRLMLDAGEAEIVLVVPTDFSQNIGKGAQADLQLLVDAQNANLAGIAAGYAAGVITDFARVKAGLLLKQSDPLRNTHNEIKLLTSVRYNPQLESQIYMVPAIIVILLFIVTCLLPALGLVREKEIGTFEQLVVTPIKKYQLILGKLIPFMILGFVEMAVALVFGALVFQVPFRGDIILLFVTAFVFIFSSAGLGMLISTVSSTQQQALFTTWFCMLFGILMSGFFTPIENMPQILQNLTYLNPLRYFMRIIRDIFLKGSSFRELQPDIAYLAIFSISMFALSWWRFRKTVT